MPDFSKREINVLLFGTLFVVLFFGYQFGIVGVLDKRDNLKRILTQKQAALEEMVMLQQQFLAVSNNFDIKTQVLANRKPDFSLFSFLDAQAQQSNVKENVAYMKPFTKKLENSLYALETVKVNLKEVYLKDLVDFLYHIESSKNGVTINSLSLFTTGKEKLMLDAVIKTQTMMLKDKI
jgi:general secretion pathway protein M